jgi:hypothetical protein
MSKKFSPNFERDYEFYFSNKERFTFSGDDTKSRVQYPKDVGKFEITYSPNGSTAKQCFYDLDSRGRCGFCSEPELLVQLLNCKASVNFHIKMWAEGRAEYTTSLSELEEMMQEYNAPYWVIKAVENQKIKLLKKKVATGIDTLLAILHWSELTNEKPPMQSSSQPNQKYIHIAAPLSKADHLIYEKLKRIGLKLNYSIAIDSLKICKLLVMKIELPKDTMRYELVDLVYKQMKDEQLSVFWDNEVGRAYNGVSW